MGRFANGGHQWGYVSAVFMTKAVAQQRYLLRGICERGDLYSEERELFQGKIYQGLRNSSPAVLATEEICKCGGSSPTVRTS